MKNSPGQTTLTGRFRGKPFWLRLLLLLAAVIAWFVFVSMVFQDSYNRIAETHSIPFYWFITSISIAAASLFFTRN